MALVGKVVANFRPSGALLARSKSAAAAREIAVRKNKIVLQIDGVFTETAAEDAAIWKSPLLTFYDRFNCCSVQTHTEFL